LLLKNIWSFYLGRQEFFESEERLSTWSYFLNSIWDKPFFGYGINSTREIGANSTFLMDIIHNIYLEILYDQGFVGFFIFILILFNKINKVKKFDKFFIFGFLLSTSFPLFFQNGFVEVNFWRYLLINRIVIDYSIRNPGGIKEILNRI